MLVLYNYYVKWVEQLSPYSLLLKILSLWYNTIDNHSSGYLGMAVEHCVRAYLGPHCILAQKQYCQKLMAQLNSTAFFTLVCVF